MDPITTLELLREAQRDLRFEDAELHAIDLGAWIKSGGFIPSDLTEREADYADECLARAAAGALADADDWTF